MKLFKPAPDRSVTRNLTRTLLQTVCFWTVLLWLAPQAIVRLEAWLSVPGFARLPEVGWGVFIVASVGGLWSGATMARVGAGTPLPTEAARRLVVSGPYRWVRNPMAVTGLAQGAGVGLMLGSFGVLSYVLAGALLWQLTVRPLEEEDLATRFGEEYLEYRRRVGLWLPRAGGR